MSEYRLGVDVGGTFTDMILLEPDGSLAVRKVLSTPPDFSQGVLTALDGLLEDGNLDADDVAAAAHGTTVATNALLTQTGARTGLITTRGFRDVLEFGRIRTPHLYDIGWERTPPLVPRELRVEVSERILATGEEDLSLDETTLSEAVATLRAGGVESVAVCLLHSYRNPVHEEAVASFLARELPGIYVSLSSVVLPEIREFERTSTTVVNAYVQPAVKEYLDRLVNGLADRGLNCPLLVMQSNGGVVSPQAAATRPIHIIESGPAAGVMGAMTIARQIGLDDLVCFDMGGTTAKASIVEGGRVSHARECEVGAGLNAGHRLLGRGGYLVRAPILDIAEVGAGGGSIARVAEGGVLKVGPQSASAVPGPVCYSRGGTEPTVTDANVVLGYLNPSSLAGGSVSIDAEAAHRAIQDKIASHLRIDLIEAAHGIHRIANAMMVRAVRSVSVERGRDPRKFTLFAIGGGGPVHGANLAETLDIKRVIVPPVPGLFSSLGLLFSPQEHHHVGTFWRRFAEVDEDELRQVLAALAEKATVELERENFSRDDVSIDLSADIQYVGQNAEINVSISPRPDGSFDFDALRKGFEAEHEAQFGYRSPSEPLQFTNVRVVGRGHRAEKAWGAPRIRSGKTLPNKGMRRRMYFGADHSWLETPVIGRDELSEHFQAGPLAIEEYDSTTIVPPKSRVRRDMWGNIEVELGSR